MALSTASSTASTTARNRGSSRSLPSAVKSTVGGSGSGPGELAVLKARKMSPELLPEGVPPPPAAHSGETPSAPVYADGQKVATLKGSGEEIAERFLGMVEEYVESHYAPSSQGLAAGAVGGQ